MRGLVKERVYCPTGAPRHSMVGGDKRETGVDLWLCMFNFKLTSYNGYHFLHTYCTCSAAPIV